MKKSFMAIVLVLIIISCSKYNTESSKQDNSTHDTEFEALKQEVAQLKAQVASLTPGEINAGIPIAEFNALKEDTAKEINALKEENENLKAQIGLFTSGFFEVEGLRFDSNGTLISLAKIDNVVSEKIGEKTLTTTRSYDAEGRLIQIYRQYTGGPSILDGSPYYWQKVIYEYYGMKCKITTQTNKYGLPAGTPYEEEITEANYW